MVYCPVHFFFLSCLSLFDSKRVTCPFMKFGDEPELDLHVGPTLLCRDEAQEVVMLHPVHTEDVPLILPRQLILCTPQWEKNCKNISTKVSIGCKKNTN